MNETAKFDLLEKEFFKTITKRNPILATSLGLHKYDDRLPDGSLESELEDINILKKFLTKFSKVHSNKLPPDKAVDLELAIHLIELWLYEKEEIRLWEAIPEAPLLIGSSIFQILYRNYAPLSKRVKSIRRRLEAMPKYIKNTMTKLRAPVKIFVETELETLSRLPGFFNTVKNIARENILPTPFYKLSRAMEDVQVALEQYTDWLIIDILPKCKKDFEIGEKKFNKLLEIRGIKDSPSKLAAFGERELNYTKDKMQVLARKIKRGAGVEDANEIIKMQHPKKFDDVLNYVRESVKKSREFVRRSNFATIPEGETLYVIETPTFLRHTTPFGAYIGPAKFEAQQEGYYFVTPGESGDYRLKEHNFPSLANMSVHEGYPGHHLQQACANSNKSLIRSFADATEIVEGWALYCEEALKNLGYEDEPAPRFIQLGDLHWRAARVILDVGLHTGKMAFGEAVDFLVENVGIEPSAAIAEVRRYASSPTYQLSYLWGKEKIKELKKHSKAKMGVRFSEKFFHDAVLNAGSLPLYLFKKELDWKIEKELSHKNKRGHPNDKIETQPSKLRGRPKRDASKPIHCRKTHSSKRSRSRKSL